MEQLLRSEHISFRWYAFHISVFLLLFLITTVAYSADTTRTRVAPGFYQIRIEDPSVPIRISALEINIAYPGVSIRSTLANNTLGTGFETTQNMARRYDSEDYQIVGAVNGDYFGISDPSNPYTFLSNLMIKDNEYVVGKQYMRSQLGLTTDGLPFVDILNFMGEVVLPNGLVLPVSGFNRQRGSDDAVLYNRYFGNSTLTEGTGVEILMKKAGEMKIGEPMTFVIEDITQNDGGRGIPDADHYVISATGEMADSLFSITQVGDTLTVLVGFQTGISGMFYAHDQEYPISGRNATRRTDEMILYDRARGSSTGTNEFGNELLLQPLEPFTFAGETRLLVVDQEHRIGDMSIPFGHYVISAHGVGREMLNEHVNPGDTVTLDLQSTPTRENVEQLMGGGPQLINDGVLPTEWARIESFQESHNLNRHPRTAVGFNEDMTRVFFVVVDGRQTASRGASMEEMAHIMYDLGAWNAVNLDGGGSSTLIIQDEWVHRPTDSDWMRPVGNALIAIAEPHDEDVFGGIRISPREKTVEVGENFTFEVRGVDKWEDEMEISISDVTWEILDLDAEFGRGGFLARGVSEGWVIAHYQEEYTDTAHVTILQEVATENESEIPEQYRLAQNYPNPFNPDTKIIYEIPENTSVRITVYNILGRPLQILVNEEHRPGTYSVRFDASSLASGTYIYELSTDSYVTRKKMTFLK